MAKGKSKKKEADETNYVWRGGKKISVEKEVDRFTIIPASPEQLEKIRSAPGIRKVVPVTNRVYKVETTVTERDSSMAGLRSDAYNVVTHHAYRPKDGEGTIFYITDRIIVQFDPKATTSQINQLLNSYGLKVLKQYDKQNSYLVQVTTTSGKNPIKVANELAEEKIVKSAEPNMINRFQPAYIPSDDYFGRQWHLDATNGAQLVAEASVNAPKAWDLTLGDRKIVVAVVDDGFDLSHPDFTGAGKVVFPKDYVDGDSNPFPESTNRDYHGTPCAGVAIAEINGKGVVGIAPGCAFMPVRFPLSADDDTLIEIFQEVGGKADVLSCSWGPPPVYAPLSQSVQDMLNDLTTNGGPRGKGCVICFAAANFNAPVNDPVNAKGFVWRDNTDALRTTQGPILNGFAAHPGVIAVAASNSLNQHSAYSNWGEEISVCAPSNNFHPLDRNAFVAGRGIWTTDNEAFGLGFTKNDRYTGVFGGTSSATPLVAGVAALVLSANPALTAAEVKEIVQDTADKIVDHSPDIILGANRGKYNAKGHCDWFGFGKVNALSAVKEAIRRKNNPGPSVPPLKTRKKTAGRKRTGGTRRG